MITRTPLINHSLLNNLGQFFEQAIDSLEAPTTGTSVDHALYATESGWTLQIDAVGINKEDISIRYEEEALIIEASHQDFPIKKRFTLGKDVDVTNIEAKLHEGVLELTLPKTSTTHNINIL